jgi:hypothetical protein
MGGMRRLEIDLFCIIGCRISDTFKDPKRVLSEPYAMPPGQGLGKEQGRERQLILFLDS